MSGVHLSVAADGQQNAVLSVREAMHGRTMRRILRRALRVVVILQTGSCSVFGKAPEFPVLDSSGITMGTTTDYSLKGKVAVKWDAIAAPFRAKSELARERYVLEHTIDTSTERGDLAMKIYRLGKSEVVQPSQFAVDDNSSFYILSREPNYLFKFASNGAIQETRKSDEARFFLSVHYFDGSLYIVTENKIQVCDTNSLRSLKELDLRRYDYQNISSYRNDLYLFGSQSIHDKDDRMPTRMVFDLRSGRYTFGLDGVGPQRNDSCYCGTSICCTDLYKSLFLVRDRAFRYASESERYVVITHVSGSGLEAYMLDKDKRVLSPMCMKEIEGPIFHDTCFFRNHSTMYILDGMLVDGAYVEVFVYTLEIQGVC
jgi:hypothetical protein